MASGPPSFPHGEGAARKRKKQRRVREGEKKPPLPPVIADPLPYYLLNNEEVLIGSKLPEGFPPELAFRALAAYSLIRTLSVELRLSPFSPNVFLRSLVLPCPNRLLGQIHVALLRVLLPAQKMGYSYSERGRVLGVSKRRVDGVWWDLRGGDNLTYMDWLTWPLFYDDYVHLTAGHLFQMMNDPELHYDSNSVALRSTTEEERQAAEYAPRTNQVTIQDRYIPGTKLDYSPLLSRRTKTEQISPPSRGDSDAGCAPRNSDSEFGDSDVEEEDDDEDYGVYCREKRSRRPSSGTGRPRGRPRGSASKSISSVSGIRSTGMQSSPNVVPGSLVPLPVKPSPKVLKAKQEQFMPKREHTVELSLQGSGIKRDVPRYPTQPPAVTTDEPSAKRTKVSYMVALAPPHVQPPYHLQGQNGSHYPLPTLPSYSKGMKPNSGVANNLPGTTAQLKQPPIPLPGAMGMVPGFMYAPYGMTQPFMPMPIPRPQMTKKAPVLHSQTTRPYSQIVAEKKPPSQNGNRPLPPAEAISAAPSWRPKLNVIIEKPGLPVLESAETDVDPYSISPDIATMIKKYQVSGSGKCADSEKSDTNVAPLSQQQESHGITNGATATPANGTAVLASANDERGNISCPDEWPQFSSVESFRNGVPHHRLPLEEKLGILEFLIDELLTVDTISTEFDHRQFKPRAYHYPYGSLPSKYELESLLNEDQCGLCGKDGELVCCDGCVRSYHSYCVGLPTGALLPGKWLCPECVTVDPSRFGPLRGGFKSTLDWFTLRDLEGVSSGMTAYPVSFPRELDETEFLVIHGFVFARNASQRMEVSSKSKENLVRGSHHLPASQKDLYRILQRIGHKTCSSWPFSQIPMDPTKIWMNVNDPTRTQQMVCYFSRRESFDPTAYINLYRMAPLSSSLSAKGSKNAVFLLSDYESECGSSNVRDLKKTLSRDMTHDIGIARCLRSSAILFNPYEMITSFVLRLEGCLRRGRLLDKNWGIRNNPRQWAQEMRECRSLKKIARKVVNLVDSCHVRVFENGWTDRASSSIGSKTLMRDTGLASASNEGRRYENLSEEWTVSGEMARRRWQRARDSNVLSLLSRESLHLDGSAHTAESVALKFARTKRKKDGVNKKDNEVWKSATFDTDGGIVATSDNGIPSPSVEGKSNSGSGSNVIANHTSSSSLSVPCTTVKDHSAMDIERVALSPQQTTETIKKSTITTASVDRRTTGNSEHEKLTVGPPVGMEQDQQRGEFPGSCLQPAETKKKPSPAYSKRNEAINTEKSSQSDLNSLGVAQISPAVVEGMPRPASRSNDIELIVEAPDTSSVETVMTENKEKLQQHLALAPIVSGAKEFGTAKRSEEVESSIEKNGAISTTDDQYKQTVIGPTSLKSKNGNGLPSESSKKKQATQTKRPKKGRSEHAANGRRRSGRLNHRKGFTNQIDSLVTSSVYVSESTSDQNVHCNDVQFDHTTLVDLERKRRLGRLEQLVANPSPEELHWPVAGRKLFDPQGYLPPSEMRRLGRNAGAVTAEFVRYSANEVGEVSAFHVWRKRMLNVNTLEDLIFQIRVLNSFIDKQTMYSCESLARRTPKAMSQVQKRVVCKQRDLQTGAMYYFVVNEGPARRRGRWFSSEDIDLSALILEHSKCIDKNLEGCERPLEKQVPPPRPRETMQASTSSLTASTSAALVGGISLASQVAIARANANMEAIIVEHGVNVGRLILRSRELGNTSILQTQIPKKRLASVLKLKSVFSMLELYGFPPKEESYITSLLIGIENAEIDKFQKLEELYQPQRVATPHEGFVMGFSQNGGGPSSSVPVHVANVAAPTQQLAELPNQFGISQRTSPTESTLQQPTVAWNQNQSLTRHLGVQQQFQPFSSENVGLQHQVANQQAAQLPPQPSHLRVSLQRQSPIEQTVHQSCNSEQAPNHLPRRPSPTENTLQQQFKQ